MGDLYAKALSKGLPQINSESVNVSDNRLTEKGVIALISTFPTSVKLLDLSYNIVGLKGAMKLGEYAKFKAIDLKILNVENAKLGDNGCEELCRLLADHQHLSELNLSRNQITAASCEAIGKVISETAEGGIKLLDSIHTNSILRVLDLSWNCLGSNKNKGFAYKLSEVFTYQDGLIHVDISHNGLKKEDCTIIAQGLATNHSLWGLHLFGNEGYVDSMGFIKVGQDKNASLVSEIEINEKRIKGCKVIGKTKNKCWICEGWSPQKFEFPAAKGTEINLHLDFENYAPQPMFPEEGYYVVWRMCPPGSCKFFFTRAGKAATNPLYPILAKHLKVPSLKIETNEVQVLEIGKSKSLVNENYEVVIRTCEPRFVGDRNLQAGLKDRKLNWKIESSIFKDQPYDLNSAFSKCLEHDWDYIKPPMMSETELALCKKFLKDHYHKLYNVYKLYSVLGRTENEFAINKTVLNDLMAHKMNLCGTPEELLDLDIAFTTIKGRLKVGKNQPKTALIRFEFIELLLKMVAKAKPLEKLKEFLEKQLPPAVPEDPQEFRVSQYWTFECDNFLSAYYELFKHLWDFKGKSQMTCDDFLNLWSEAKLINERFTERDAVTAFIQTKKVEVDELDNDQHMKMTLAEFMEGVARVAFIIGTDKYGQKTPVEAMESLVTRLLGVAKKEFREKFRKPEKRDGIYIVTTTVT